MTSQAPRHITKTVGQNVRAARKSAGLTQRALAGLVGVDTLAVWRWEHAKSMPMPSNLTALAHAMDRDVAWFYTEHEAVAA